MAVTPLSLPPTPSPQDGCGPRLECPELSLGFQHRPRAQAHAVWPSQAKARVTSGGWRQGLFSSLTGLAVHTRGAQPGRGTPQDPSGAQGLGEPEAL